MRLNPPRQRTGLSSGKGANSAYRAASRRTRPRRMARRRTAIAAGRRRSRRRRPLLFYAVTAAVTGQLVAIAVDVEALVLFFSLTELLLAAVVFQAVKA